MTSTTRRYYPGITVFKFLGSMLVLTAHIRIPASYKSLANQLTGLEQFSFVLVPCFYIIAGFLAYNGWSNAKNPHQYIKRYLIWIVGLYLLMVTVYLITTFIPSVANKTLSSDILTKKFKGLIFDLLVRGPIMSFWFIPPLIAGISISYFFERKKILAWGGVVIMLGLIAAHLFNGTLRTILELLYGEIFLSHAKNLPLYQKFLFNYCGQGVPFVFVGVVLAKYENRFLNLNGYWLALTVTAFTIAEALLLFKYVGGHFQYKLVLSMIPLSLWAFFGILKVKFDAVKTYHTTLNTISIVTYFSHAIFIKLNVYLSGVHLVSLSTHQSLLFALLTLVECLGLSVIILALKKKSLITSNWWEKKIVRKSLSTKGNAVSTDRE